ncbi:MAG: hypothetical protein E6J90_04620 [Deltaproteobacteria bacterium]|nr:MAG: hypothetical protein E6J91_10230 [Deltaproteobacteria bacterium]TMQ26265.1 MAG: hypothetical protein E6J90_04620 [Deltaproteobacteria bacterium]
MMLSDQPEIVTVVASPPPGTSGPTDNNFIDAALQTLATKNASANRVVRAASVRDLDIELGKILTDHFKGAIRLQIIGHSISGMLSLGASWIPDAEMVTRAFKFPHYVLDTNPSSLGLIAKYAGKISEVMLVGCNVGSASSFGYAVNGRTLTYTLAELLRCTVRGADDVVAPDEFDARGWYAPGEHRRRPKGWRWAESMPPVWTELGVDPVRGGRLKTTQSFELRAITRSLLPMFDVGAPREARRPIRISCKYIATEPPQSALPELHVETDRGPAELLCGGRYLRWGDTSYVVDQTPQLSAALIDLLWRADHDAPVSLASGER